jgi:hypothetical protein
MYERLLDPQLLQRVDWSRVHLWWGDERYVPRGDPLSNTFLADQALLAGGGLPIPAGQVHPFPTDEALTGGLGPDWCAATYAAEVVGSVPLVDGWPSFTRRAVGTAATAISCRCSGQSGTHERPGRAGIRPDPSARRRAGQPERPSSSPPVGSWRWLPGRQGRDVAQVLEGPRDPRAAGRPPGRFTGCRRELAGLGTARRSAETMRPTGSFRPAGRATPTPTPSPRSRWRRSGAMRSRSATRRGPVLTATSSCPRPRWLAIDRRDDRQVHVARRRRRRPILRPVGPAAASARGSSDWRSRPARRARALRSRSTPAPPVLRAHGFPAWTSMTERGTKKAS